MPTLHSQFLGEQQDKNGNKIPVVPKLALSARGPVIQVTIGIEENFAQQLIQGSQSIPEPKSGLALIDTGVSMTCIDEELAKILNLPVIDKATMSSASHNATEKDIYPILIQFIGVPIKVNVPRAMGASLNNQGIIALLGRDALQNFTMFYNGLAGEITLSI